MNYKNLALFYIIWDLAVLSVAVFLVILNHPFFAFFLLLTIEDPKDAKPKSKSKK
jgi:hypothetical protein